jgi:heptosyltransferase-2
MSVIPFKKVLIIQTAFIGDVILVTPLIRIVSEKFPDSEIHFLTIPASQNTVETLPYINQLWIYDKHGSDAGLTSLIKLTGKLRHEHFDLALIPHRSLRSAFLVFLAGIRRRVGFDRSSGSFLFTDTVPYQDPGHEIERNFRLLKPLTVEIPDRQLPDLRPDSNDRDVITNWLISQQLDNQAEMICMAPGSIWPTKRWLPQYWASLAARFKSRKWEVIFIGSDMDRPLISYIANMAGIKISDASGQFTIRQSAEIIRRCRLLICNDSAPTHMGNAVRTPVLTIFGCTVPSFGFYPYGIHDRIAEVEGLPCRPCTDHGRKKCPLKHFKCMVDLSTETIFDLAWKMIHEHRPDRSE